MAVWRLIYCIPPLRFKYRSLRFPPISMLCVCVCVLLLILNISQCAVLEDKQFLLSIREPPRFLERFVVTKGEIATLQYDKQQQQVRLIALHQYRAYIKKNRDTLSASTSPCSTAPVCRVCLPLGSPSKMSNTFLYTRQTEYPRCFVTTFCFCTQSHAHVS